MLSVGNDQLDAFKAERNFHQQARDMAAQRAGVYEFVEEILQDLGKKDAQVESRVEEQKKIAEPNKDASFKERASRNRAGSVALEKEKAELNDAITKDKPRMSGTER